jgi:hypothetical protein
MGVTWNSLHIRKVSAALEPLNSEFISPLETGYPIAGIFLSGDSHLWQLYARRCYPA